jgi:hypothetical protein
MAKAFSVASWNVRHFGESEQDEERVAFLAEQTRCRRDLRGPGQAAELARQHDA